MAIKVLANTGEIIDFNETKTHEKDTRSLCGAKHDVAIGITKMSDRAQPVPFEDYIVVHFRPYDTSGGGEAMLKMQEAVKGSTLFLTDGDAYNDALAAGRAGGRGAHNQAELVGGEAQRHDVVDQRAQVHVEHLLPAAGQRRPSASRLQTQHAKGLALAVGAA